MTPAFGPEKLFSENKLSSYLALSSCFLLTAGEVDAQFAIYTDLDPDSTVATEFDTISTGSVHLVGFLEVDLNRDGYNDVGVDIEIEDPIWSSYVNGLIREVPSPVGTCRIATFSYWTSSTYGASFLENAPVAFGPSDSVDAASNFAPLPRKFFSTYYGFISTPWPSPASIGIKYNDGSDDYFGWVRLNRREVLDFAIDPVAGNSIAAWPSIGPSLAPPVHSIDAVQTGGAVSFADFELTFEVPSDEAGISEYRIFAVKQDSLLSFDEATALGLPADRYQVYTPTSMPFASSLGTALKDVDGDVPIFNEYYHFLVMSIADGVLTTQNNLWSCSPAVQYKSQSAIPGTPIVTDTADFNDARDIHISFDKAADETGITEYRVFISKSSPPIDVDTLPSLPTNRYFGILPTGGALSAILPANLLDTDGDSIRSDIYYNAHVLSVADSVALLGDVLSEGVLFKLDLFTRAVQNLMVSDVSDLDNGEDLEIDFEAAVDEVGIVEYRAYVNPSTWPGAIALADSLLTLPVDRYLSFVPGSPTYNSDFAGKTDINGDDICGTCSYRVQVISLGNDVVFMDHDGTSEIAHLGVNTDIESLSLAVVDTFPNAGAFEVSFPKADDESHISAYRIFLGKFWPSGVDKDDLIAVPSGNYFDVLPTGVDLVAKLPPGLKTYDGSDIALLTSYRAKVLTIPDSIGAYLVGESPLSNSAGMLNFQFIAKNLLPEDIADFDNGADLQIKFDKATYESFVNEYRIMVAEASYTSIPYLIAIPSSSRISVVPDGGPTYSENFLDVLTIEGAAISGDDTYFVHLVTILDNHVNVEIEEVNLNLLSTGTAISEAENFDGGIVISDGQLQITSGSNRIERIRIFDQLGREHFSSALSTSFVINFAAWPRGIYFVQLELENGTVTRKFFK